MCPRCGTALAGNELEGGCPKCFSTFLFSPHAAPPPLTDESPVLQRIGDYELFGEIARGGMGVVFRARQVSLNRIVAVKLMRDSGLARPADVERFHAEAASAAKLKHPNVVSIHEVGEQAGQHFFAMDLIEGANLAERTREGPLPVRAAAELVATISEAVQHAHALGVLHRDLKPSNILIDDAGVPYVTDFGLARLLDGCGSLTVTGQLLGTPAYMAPEQARGVAVDPSADVYSLGAVLYHVLTGRAPFIGSSVTDVLHQVVSSEPLAPQLLNPSVPLDLSTICLKCLEKDPRHRFRSARELADDLKCWLGGEPISARPSTLLERSLKWVRRKPAVAGLAASLLAVVLAGSTGILWQWRAAVDARKVAEARAVTESRAKASAEQERQNAQRAYAQATDSLSRLEVQRAEELFRADKAAPALAHLARVLRDNPTNTIIAERIIDALTHRSFAIPTVAFLPAGNYNTQFSPNSRWIAASTSTNVHIFDSQTGEPVGPGVSGYGGQITFSPDSRWVAVRSETAIQIIESQTGRQSGPILAHTNSLHFITFSPDSRLLLTGCGKAVRVWDCATGESVGQTLNHTNSVISGEISPDGRWVVTLSSTALGKTIVQVWDVDTGLSRFEPISFDIFVQSKGFGVDGTTVRLLSRTGLHLWNCLTGSIFKPRLGEEDTSPIKTISLSPHGEKLLTDSATSSTSIQIWQIPTGRLLATLPVPWADGYTGQFSPDSLRVLIRTATGQMQIWDVAGRLLGEISNPPAVVSSSQFSPNGNWVLASYQNSTTRIWDGYTGVAISEPIRFEAPWMGGEFSPDGRRILARSSEKRVDNHTAPTSYKLVLWEIRWGSPTGETYHPENSLHDQPVPPEWLSESTLPSITNSPIPGWLPDMAEGVVGQRFNEQRDLEAISVQTRLNLRERVLGTADNTVYRQWAEWFFANVETRPISPFSKLAVPEYIRHCIDRNTRSSFISALRLAPTNGLLLAHFARCILNQNPTDDPQFEGDADAYSRRALELAPSEPVAWLVRAEVLFAGGRQTEARETIEKGTERFPEDPDLWDQLAAIRESQGQFEEAGRDYSKAIDLSAKRQAWPPEKRAHYMAHRSDLLRQQHRVNDAESDFNSSRALDQAARRDDWPGWGGHDLGRNMYSAAHGLPSDFDPGRMRPYTEDFDRTTLRNVKWVAKLGSQSYGNPTVAGGKVFVGTNNENPRHSKHRGDRSILLCLDEKQGGLLWQLVVPKLKSGKVNDWESLGLLSSPAIEGNRVYLASTRGEALCLTTEGLAWRNVGPFKRRSTVQRWAGGSVGSHWPSRCRYRVAVRYDG